MGEMRMLRQNRRVHLKRGLQAEDEKGMGIFCRESRNDRGQTGLSTRYKYT